MLLGDGDRGLYTWLLDHNKRWQLSAKFISLKSKYRITFRAVVNYKISVRSYGGIRIGIDKPLQVIRKDLTSHRSQLTLVFKVIKHNRIVAV